MATEVIASPDLVVFRVRGPLTGAEALSVVDGHFSSTPTKLALWDLREASLSAFRADEISSLVEAGARHLERRGAGAKTAVVTAGEWDEALLRVYEARALAALGEVRFRVFNDADRAREWLCDPA